MALLNVVYIYDLSLITHAFFCLLRDIYLKHAHCNGSYVFGDMGVQSLVYVCMYVGGLGIRNLGKVERDDQKEIFNLLCGERSLYV